MPPVSTPMDLDVERDFIEVGEIVCDGILGAFTVFAIGLEEIFLSLNGVRN